MGRGNKNDRSELAFLGVGNLIESSQTGRFLLEFLDPLVQKRKCYFCFVAFVGVAVVDDDQTEVTPLGDEGLKFIFLADLLLPF